MNHSSYRIYITSSSKAAYIISRGLRETIPWSKQGGKTLGVSSGCIRKDCRIPELYHGDDKFFALIEYRNGENFDHPEYEIIIC